MKSRKLLAIMLTSSLLLSGASLSVKASGASETAAEPVQKGSSESKSSNDITTEKLSEITKKVKSKILIPSEFTEFEYEYYGALGTDEFQFHLNWNKKEDGPVIRVQCDSEGNISSYYYETNQKDRYIPKYKKNQLQENADNFLKKVMPESLGNVKPVEGGAGNPYSDRYIYAYERVKNGIPLPENKILIEVNYESGEVVSFQSSWEYGLSFPSDKALISEKQAKDKLKEKLTMNLAYHPTYEILKNGGSKEKNFLAYTPNTAFLAVDAISGELYTSKGERYSGTNPLPRAQMEEAAMDQKSVVRDAGGSSLTGEEIKKIDEISDILSSQETISAIKNNPNLLLDKNATKVTAGLYQRKDAEGKRKAYQWEIRFNLPKEDQSGYGYYAHAAVNAKTGKILSFSANRPNDRRSESVPPKYTKAEAQKRMEAFLTLQIPEYFKQCTQIEENTNEAVQNNGAAEDRTDRYIFQFNRVNKNIPYYGNGINASIDAETGKIFEYSYLWDEGAVFQNPDNRISEQAAEDAYLSFDQTPLMYEINWINNKPNVRLVYRTMIQPFYVSPFTGKQLGYDGTEYSSQKSVISYQDIGESSAKESIEILADLGLGFPGGLFYPKKAITVEDWKLLEGGVLNSYESREILNKWEVWNSEKKTMTRLDAAKYCVIVSGLNKAAVLQDTYQVTYQDKDKIKETDAGYVMLAKGLKLVTGDSKNNFNPDAPVTREEAAQMIMDLIKQR